MRNLFTTLKSIVAAAIVASMTLAASCSYDDTAIKNRVDQVEQDLATLAERVTALENQLKTDVANLTELINGKVVVTGVTVDENGATTVTLSDGKSFVVYPEVEDTDTNTTIVPELGDDNVLYWAIYNDGEFTKWLELDGEKVKVYDGNDQCTCVPVVDTNDNDDTIVAPYKDAEDGEYYYAIIDVKNNNAFVEWYLVDGEKVKVYDGNDDTDTICECKPVELTFKVDDNGNLVFSLDGGATWAETGLSASSAGAQLFSGVVDNGAYVTFTLAGGAEFTVIKAELIEFNATRGQLYVLPGETKELPFTINTAVADVNVMNQPLGWKAEVALAPVEEEESGDDEMGVMPLAVGGTELVLKITGPSKEFVDAGFAAKEGEIAIHFNGNNGTCQVGKIAVNLAELTLAVDKNGNVHIENSVAVTTTDYWGEEYTDFAPIQIGVMTKANYDAFLAGTLNMATAYEDGDFNFTTYGFSNIVDVLYYEEGVCEKAVYDFTIADVSKMFYPNYEFVAGNEYVLFLYTEETLDMSTYSTYPVLESAIVAEYKSVLVDVTIVEGSVTWNDATLKMSLAGFTNYLVGWVSDAYVQEMISYNMCTDLNSFLDMWLKSQSGSGINMDAGAIISDGMPLGTELKLSEMAEYSMTYWAPAVEPNNTYYLYVYPFNMETEMDLYALAPTHEDAYLFGTFTTANITKGDFVVEPTYTPTYGSYTMEVEVTFAEEYTIYYEFYSEGAIEEDERIAQVFEDCYQSQTGTTVYAEAYNYGEYPQYLSMVVINAAGEYVYVEKEFTGPVPEVFFTFTTATDLGGNKWKFSNEAGEYITIPFGSELKAGTYVTSYYGGEGTYDYNNGEVYAPEYGFDNGGYASWFTGSGKDLVVTETDGVYSFTFQFSGCNDFVNYTSVLCEATFTGTLGAEEPALETKEITEFIYEGRWYELDDDESTVSGSDFVYTVKGADFEYRLGVYYALANEDGTLPIGTINYCYNAFDMMYASWNGFVIVSDNVYYNSTLVVEEGKITLNIDGVASYVYEGEITIGGADEGGNEEAGDGTITLTNLGEAYTTSYYTCYPFSDASGENAVTIVVDTYSGVYNGFIAANQFTTFQSSYGYVTNGQHFSFIDESLKINGVAIANNDVTAASLSVVNGDTKEVTLKVTVDGTEYTLQYNN